MQNTKTKAANLLFTSLRGRVVSWFCHINHFSISPVPRDYAHFTLHSPNLGTMETGGRQSPEIRVVNQTEPNKRRMSFFVFSRWSVWKRGRKSTHHFSFARNKDKLQIPANWVWYVVLLIKACAHGGFVQPWTHIALQLNNRETVKNKQQTNTIMSSGYV